MTMPMIFPCILTPWKTDHHNPISLLHIVWWCEKNRKSIPVQNPRPGLLTEIELMDILNQHKCLQIIQKKSHNGYQKFIPPDLVLISLSSNTENHKSSWKKLHQIPLSRSSKTTKWQDNHQLATWQHSHSDSLTNIPKGSLQATGNKGRTPRKQRTDFNGNHQYDCIVLIISYWSYPEFKELHWWS